MNAEHPWKVWKFPTKMRWEGFWKDKNIQKAFLDDYAREAGMISWREWKRVSMVIAVYITGLIL